MSGYSETVLRTKLAVLAVLVLPLTLAATVATAEEGTLERRLRDLKSTCDQGLMSETECANSRKALIETFNSGRTESDGSRKSVGASCDYVDSSLAVASFSIGQEFNPSASALQIVREILDQAGLGQNFIIRQGPVANAAAVVDGYERYVLYNPDFLSQLKTAAGTNWAVYSVMAHEIGHHLEGHTLQPGGSRPPTELQADRYSGFILAKLGATLDDARIAMSRLGNDAGSSTHPPKAQRLTAISEGWEKGNAAASKRPELPRSSPSREPEVERTPDPSPCEDVCDRVGERECVDDEEAQVCRRDSDGCLVWEPTPCDDGEECSSGRCRRIRDGGTGSSARMYCCDQFGNRRCIQTVNPSPVGAPCFCMGQGVGLGCN